MSGDPHTRLNTDVSTEGKKSGHPVCYTFITFFHENINNIKIKH